MPQQQQLFETEPAPWELDAAGEQLVATVVFPEGPEQPFDYKVPDGLREAIGTGRRVQAPFGAGNRMVEGYCVRLGNADRRASAAEAVGGGDRPSDAAVAHHAAADRVDG